MRLFIVLIAVVLSVGCHHVRPLEQPTDPHVSVVTWNVNAGAYPEDLATTIRAMAADVVCLQETTPAMAATMRRELAGTYPHMDFRQSEHRMAGGLAILSRWPMREVAYIPSGTRWFDGWIAAVQTPIGEVQILNVHLQPPVSEEGRPGVRGYLSTGDERQTEIARFYERRAPDLPLLAIGDFNDSPDGPPVRWLEAHGLTNALEEFDRDTPTWRWRTRFVTLKRRMDHILYTPDLYCFGAAVVPSRVSDHSPVIGVFRRQSE